MENNTAVNTNQAAAPDKTVTPAVDMTEDMVARFAQLEAEKAKAIEEAANYKLAFLKEKTKQPENFENESEEDKMRRIAQETLANSRVADIAREQDELLQRALKENKELKLAQLNKTNTPPAVIGSHNEAPTVQDTLVTPEQMAAFKARGWSDKDIERYKKNLQRYSGR